MRGCRLLTVLVIALAVNAFADDGPTKALLSKTDVNGDPLPAGAVARFGSGRLRHAGLSDFLFLHDGKTLLSTGTDGVLRFWDSHSGRQVRTVRLQGAGVPARFVKLSANGKVVAAHDWGTIVLWDVETGKELRRARHEKDDIAFLHISPDGKAVITGDWNSRVTVWEWQTGKERQFKMPWGDPSRGGKVEIDRSFSSVSPNGKWLVTGGRPGMLYVHEITTGRETYRLDCDQNGFTFSADGKSLTVFGRGGRGRGLFDLDGGKAAVFALDRSVSAYSAFALSPDGKTLACGGTEKSCLLDCASGRMLHRLPGRPWKLVFAPDGKTLAFSDGRRLHLWDVAKGSERHEAPGDFGNAPVLAVSPDGRTLAAGDWLAREVSLWDTSSGRPLRRLPLRDEEYGVISLAFLPDGKLLLAGLHTGVLKLWNLATGAEHRTVQAHLEDAPFLLAAQMSADGKQAITLHPSSVVLGVQVTLCDIVAGKLQRSQFLPGEVRTPAWSNDRKVIAAWSQDGLILIDVPSAQTRFRVEDSITGGPIAISPDNRFVAARRTVESPTGRTNVGIWETASGKEVAGLAGGRVAHLAFAPDYRSLVTADAAAIRVWDLATGKERLHWPPPISICDATGRTAVFRLVLSPDGRRAYTALADGSALAWDLTAAPAPSRDPGKPANEKELTRLWADLASDDVGRAYAAVWRLAQSPSVTVTFLRRHLKPADAAEFDRARNYIEDLDSNSFQTREQACAKLEELGATVVPLLRQALANKPPLEVRRRLDRLLARPATLVTSLEVLRRLRAILVLEQIASEDARKLLGELARGTAVALQTEEARSALQRLSPGAAKP